MARPKPRWEKPIGELIPELDPSVRDRVTDICVHPDGCRLLLAIAEEVQVLNISLRGEANMATRRESLKRLPRRLRVEGLTALDDVTEDVRFALILEARKDGLRAEQLTSDQPEDREAVRQVVQRALERPEIAGKAPRPDEVERYLAMELVRSSLPVMVACGLDTAATAAETGVSSAVKLLVVLGEAVNLPAKPDTWRRRLAEAKNGALRHLTP